MGFLRDLKDQVKAATAMAADAKASMQAPGRSTTLGTSAPSGHVILNPTPQADIDRMLAGGREGRAVVIAARHDMSDGERSLRTRVRVTVRKRERDQVLGESVDLKAWVGWKVAVLLEPGLEVPVELDPNTGRVSGIDSRALADELAPRSDEAKRRHSGFTVDLGLDGITQAPGVIRDLMQPVPAQPGLSAQDPLLAAIDGVSWQQFVAVKAETSTRPSPEGVDAVAQRHGVPSGAWAGVESAWTQRMMTSPAMAQHLGQEIEAARRALRDGR